MTNAEAIEVLRQKYRTVSQCLTADECRENNEALSIAISALERDMWTSAEEPPKENGAYMVYLHAPLDFDDAECYWGYVTEMRFDKGADGVERLKRIVQRDSERREQGG